MMRTPFHLARSAGVGLVTAIFLLVVLAGLGTAMVALYTAQQAGSDLDLQGARAYQAARAGIEWGLWQRRRGTCTAAPTTVAMAPGSSLAGFTVVVSCTPAANGPANITSYACNMTNNGLCTDPEAFNNPAYVQRHMEVQA